MDNTSGAPTLMPLHLLEEITNDFSDDQKVGAGSYGSVYKGEHKNGETIAVKLLHYIPGLDDEQFKKEYLNLASLQHKNIVRLVGYCHETRREILPFDGKMVFAEMTREHFVSNEFTGHDWCTRYAIIKGICQGLKYLHEELQSPMYHLDIKPANVLLDDNMFPKLADFGLSRLFSGGKTQVTKSALGTHGYVPPEYIDAAVISNKFDIFSLGVVIIKIMTGPTGYFRIDEMSSQQFIELVHANWTKRLYETSMYLLDSYYEQVRRCIEIALSCVEADRYKRPSIGLIISKLNETETMIQSPDRDMGSSIYKIFHCISIAPLNKLSSYSLHVNDNRGRSHKITISTICQPEDNTATFEAIRPEIMIIDCTEDLGLVCTTDVHPTEPWILVGHGNGHVSIWNHQTQARLMTFDILNKPSLVVSAVRFITSMYKILLCAVRFIAQKQWFVAGDYEGHIHVYTYTTKYKLRKFQAHANMVNSLAVHPTDPFVLSSSNDNLIKLWNWENDWECIRTFQAHSKWVESVKFNPLATSNTFASASRDGTIKIWSMFSDTPITTLECGMAELTSVHYFVVHGNQEFIVAGSASGTACIWDLGMETCIRNVNGLQEKWCTVAVVNCLPRHPILVTVSQDHIVSFCNSNTHRYKNMVDFRLGRIMDFAYTKVTRSLVIAGECGIALMKII
ncbi:hypothetical protein QYE76_056771 [Lolium multiflorum]|uniref:non-specific serine/threonine protein kinase n=1 Tax=Lolium multiflorum TaxID=4521 RepID=A0AAD8T2R7_LOLMU|nr:hypothetical protein QYE76_056771 [Lolium multiflorum]